MYNSGFTSIVSGDLDVASFQAAVHMICQRHEVCGGRHVLVCVLLSRPMEVSTMSACCTSHSAVSRCLFTCRPCVPCSSRPSMELYNISYQRMQPKSCLSSSFLLRRLQPLRTLVATAH